MEDQTVPAQGAGSQAGGGWAVPGSGEEQPAPVDGPAAPGSTAPADGAGAGRAGAGGRVVDHGAPNAGSVPQVALRPMTVADVLDGGFSVVKARPRRILGLAAALIVPTQLVLALLQRSTSVNTDILDFINDPTVANEDVSGGDLANQYLLLAATIVISGLVLVFLASAIGHLVGQWIMGRDAPAGEMMAAAGRRWWPLVGSFFVIKAAEVVSVLGCYVGLLFVMPLFVVVAPVVGVEGGGAMGVIGRGVRLVRARYFPVMGVAVLMGLVATLLSSALSALPQGLAVWIGLEDAWPLVALGAIASEIVVVPFVAAATVLLYFDLRVRTEGLDLEMTAARVLDRAG